MSPVERKSSDALSHFKDWSNYLLITTVAALGWVSTDVPNFSGPALQVACIASLAASIIFAILTLAAIPIIAEKIKDEPSIFKVQPFSVIWRTWTLVGKFGVKWVCLPQHLLFLAGIVLYAVGTSFAFA